MAQAHPSDDQLDILYAALANTKRRGIVTTLSFRPATVSQLAKEHHISLPAIHKHLIMLENAQMIQRRKIGRISFIALKRAGLQQAQIWLNQFHTDWGHDQETLENYITSFPTK